MENGADRNSKVPTMGDWVFARDDGDGDGGPKSQVLKSKEKQN